MAVKRALHGLFVAHVRCFKIDAGAESAQVSFMRVVKSVKKMRELTGEIRKKGSSIGFVPTMGSLHAGHISLAERARQWVGEKGCLVVSIYVNPTQFGPKEDFSKYPRDLKGDAKLCRAAGVDVLFAPSDAEMYPAGQGNEFSTYVVETRLSQMMEGVSRPTHFRGVTTVVSKLFNIVDPDVAVFGQKDYQQAAIVQRMARDLNFRMKVIVAPTMREPDGLAMSSRNRYLSPSERQQAVGLWRALQTARREVRRAGKALPVGEITGTLQEIFAEYPAARVDYISFFDPNTLQPVEEVRRGTHLALAVVVGKTRLIDNGRL